MSNNNSSEDEDMGVIRCICDYEHDDGFTIQCDKCYVWQHAICVGIENSNVPESYLCEICNPRNLDFEFAKQIQKKNFEENAYKGSKRKSSTVSNRKNGRSKNESSSGNKKRQYNYRKSSRQEDCTKQIQQFSHDESLIFGSQKAKAYADDLFEKWSKRNELNNGNVLDYEESIFEIQSCDSKTQESLPSKTALRKLDNDSIKTTNQKGCFSAELIKKGSLISDFRGIISLKEDYIEDPLNYYKYLNFPLPFVFFHSSQNLVVDCRKQGNNTRFIRMNCNPNAVLKSYFITDSKSDILHLGIFALTEILPDEEITILWDIDTSKFSTNLFSSKHYKTPQFQSSVKSIIKNLSKEFGEETLQVSLPEHLENINSWIKYIKKCSCNKGLDCRYNRFFKISKKIWKDKLSQVQKTSCENSSQSNSVLDESVYSETTPQLRLIEHNERMPSSLCLFPIRLFDEINDSTDIDKKSRLPVYLCKNGMKKYFIHKFRKLETKLLVPVDKPTTKITELQNTENNIEDAPDNTNERTDEYNIKNVNREDETHQETLKSQEMDKMQKMDFIKKLNNFKNDITTNDSSPEPKIANSRPKSKSFSDHSYNSNAQKNKITLLEYLAKINANSNTEKHTERISSLPEISIKEVEDEKIGSEGPPLLPDLENTSKEQGINKETDCSYHSSEPFKPSQHELQSNDELVNESNTIDQRSSSKPINLIENSHQADPKPSSSLQKNDFTAAKSENFSASIEDKLDFGENELENSTSVKNLEDTQNNKPNEPRDSKNAELELNRETEVQSSKDAIRKTSTNSHKRSHSPYSKKEKTSSYNGDYYYDRDDYYYRRNYHSTSNIRHHSDYKHEQPQYNRDYYNTKHYYDDRERADNRYKTHYSSDYNGEHKPYDKYSYNKHYRGYYPDRKTESRYGYLSHPNREKATHKPPTHDPKKPELTSKPKTTNSSQKEDKIMSSPLSNLEINNPPKRDTNSEINGYTSHKNNRDSNCSPCTKNIKYEDYKPSIKQQRNSEYLKQNTTYQ